MGNMLNLITNGGVEGGADPPAGWTQETNATVVSDTSPHSGVNCMKVTAGAANVGGKQNVTLVSGKYYTVSGWAKVTAGDSATIIMDKGDTATVTVGTITATSWTKIAITFLSTGAAGVIYCRAVANTDIVWFDDCNIIQLDQVVPSTATPSTAANSFTSGKWNDLLGSYQADGLDTITFASSEIPTSKGTIAFYANIQSPYTTGDDKVFFDVRGADDNNRIKIYYQASDDKFTVYINGANRLQASAEIDNTKFYTWIHVALSYDFDNDNYALYLNGTSVATDTTSLTAPTLSGNAFIGSDYSSTNQGDIMIDEFRIYDFAMVARQVNMLYYTVKPTWK